MNVYDGVQRMENALYDARLFTSSTSVGPLKFLAYSSPRAKEYVQVRKELNLLELRKDFLVHGEKPASPNDYYDREAECYRRDIARLRRDIERVQMSPSYPVKQKKL